jgi:cell division transport system permease protein
MHCSLRELKRAPIINAITVCVIGITIALPLGFFILVKNLQVVHSNWNTNAPTISLYLKESISTQQLNDALQMLRTNTQIAQVNYISPAQGLAEFEKNTAFSAVLSLFQNNPLPGVITILPAPHYQNPNAINTLFLYLKTLPIVDVAQLDMNWVTRLFDILSIGEKITSALTVFFGIGIILIISHTLRTSLADHADEIQVMRLIGATRAYIRRPLLYRGILYGLLGGIVSLALTIVFFATLQSPIARLAQTYKTSFQLNTVSASQGMMVIFFSALLGLIGAWLIALQFLNQPEKID